MKQEGLVAEFRRAFEVLATPLKDLPDEVPESTFMNGLLPKIWAEICLLGPIGLGQIMEVAQKVEDRNLVLKSAKEASAQKIHKFIQNPIKARTFSTKAVTVENRLTNNRREAPIKRMTDIEWRSKREKGLCFRCEEKYTIGHRCKNRELRVLLVQDCEEEGAADYENPVEELSLEVTETVELSLNSVIGLTRQAP